MWQIIAAGAALLAVLFGLGLLMAFISQVALGAFGIHVSIWAAWAVNIVVMIVARTIAGFGREQMR